jgi:hypothetical protein
MKQRLHFDATVDPDETVFLAWLSGDVAIGPAIESLLSRARAGQKLLLVGELADDNGYPRIGATHRFCHYLQDNFETQSKMPPVNYACFQGRGELLLRK